MIDQTKCPHSQKCGGCQLQGVPYREQLRKKQEKMERLLGRFHPVETILGMENPVHYRNKVQAAFGLGRKGEIVSGVYEASTHRIVPVESCLLEDEKADEILGTIRGLLKSFKLPPFNDVTMQGFLRHALIRRGFQSGQIMAVLVTGSPVFPSKKAFVKALLDRHPEITTVVQNINDRRTSMVLGSRSEVLYGTGKIEEQLCGFTFRISPSAFYQVNSVQTEVLYGKALEYAGLTGVETVVDAYCGTGTIGILASPRAKQVIGVELNPDAVKDARENARRNSVKNITFVCADAGEFLAEGANSGEKADVIIIDPPRTGCSPEFLHALIRLSPTRIVYISCGPETLARDLDTLTKSGYQVRAIQPVDMFPYTEHVECVVLMTRVEK